jgi:hypothetical protein
LKRTYEIDAESEKNAEAWCAAIAKQIEHKQAVRKKKKLKLAPECYKRRCRYLRVQCY